MYPSAFQINPAGIAIEIYLAADDLTGGFFHQPDDGKAGHAFTASGFAHQTQRLPFVQVETDAVHGLDYTASGEKMCFEIFYFQYCFGVHILQLP